MIDYQTLYQAYGEGIFPMADGAEPDAAIRWYCPEYRAVLIPQDFHVPRRLKRSLRHSGFTVRWQDDFEAVMRGCAERPDEGTWINESMIHVFTELAHAGKAYCLSVFQGNDRVGGIYGVCLGGVITAESMFSRVSNASSAALVVLMHAAHHAAIDVVDIQLPNAHTRRFKPTVIPHEVYMDALQRGLNKNISIEKEDIYSAALDVLSMQSFSHTS